MASSRPRTRWSTTRSTSLSTAAFSYTTAVYASAGRARSDVGSPAGTVTTRGPPSSAERDPGCRRRQPAHLFGGQTFEHGDFADDLFHSSSLCLGSGLLRRLVSQRGIRFRGPPPCCEEANRGLSAGGGEECSLRDLAEGVGFEPTGRLMSSHGLANRCR